MNQERSFSGGVFFSWRGVRFYLEFLLGVFRKEDVEKQVDYYAGDGDIHPYWPGPFGDLSVPIKPFAQSVIKSYENHRQNYNRQNDVRDENEIIEDVDSGRWMTQGGVGGGIIMIPEIAREKDGRGDKGRYHGIFMSCLIVFFDEEYPSGKKTDANPTRATLILGI